MALGPVASSLKNCPSKEEIAEGGSMWDSWKTVWYLVKRTSGVCGNVALAKVAGCR